MVHASGTAGPGRGLTVHNDGTGSVTVRVRVGGPEAAASAVTLASGATATVEAIPTATVEATPPAAVTVHADGASATAPADCNPAFVVREASVLVAPG
ncbi:hypothetical protein BRC85_11200 [Halobacteriales archaeon QS_1_69_70]|nr:MAG: hypothetical protein BRC85_11200 [Halobacteriales archaeon QS_1_69_70]